jgi:hypothetical protein
MRRLRQTGGQKLVRRATSVRIGTPEACGPGHRPRLIEGRRGVGVGVGGGGGGGGGGGVGGDGDVRGERRTSADREVVTLAAMNGRTRNAPPRNLLGALALVAAGILWTLFGGSAPGGDAGGPGGASVVPSRTSAVGAADVGRLRDAVARRAGDVWVEVPARVVKALPDDEHPPRHQRFLVRVADLPTILVAHNVDLAPRVPIVVDDEIEIRGEFEWNDKGGVLHWTHRDPQGRKPGGWIRRRGVAYE